MTDLSTATATDVVVRMGELAASASAGDVLVCVGLGSCIGLALVCRRGRACGLAHIVLPESGGRDGRPAGQVRRARGARADRAPSARSARAPTALEAILVGGAQMFSTQHRHGDRRPQRGRGARRAAARRHPRHGDRDRRRAWAARSASTSPPAT